MHMPTGELLPAVHKNVFRSIIQLFGQYIVNYYEHP